MRKGGNRSELEKQTSFAGLAINNLQVPSHVRRSNLSKEHPRVSDQNTQDPQLWDAPVH